MGCDIHLVIQRKEADGNWHEVPYQHKWNEDQPTAPNVAQAPWIFRNRNYDLFGILADVRNGRGWPSIAPDRGLPVEFSEKIVAPDPNYPDDGPRSLGDHSFTWIGLEELKAFDWDGTRAKLYGVVPADRYEVLTQSGDAPKEYSGHITGPGIIVYTPEQYRAVKTAGTLAPRPYVRMSWAESAREATYDWPGKIVPWLEKLADGRPLRLVMGFDS